MNQINVIQPYWHGGTWVFDDPEKDLDKEPFVAGADRIITLLVQAYQIPDPKDGFALVFSADPFPGAQAIMNWEREEMGGNVYSFGASMVEGWLCPALLRYFDAAPKQIHVEVRRLLR